MSNSYSGERGNCRWPAEQSSEKRFSQQQGVTRRQPCAAGASRGAQARRQRSTLEIVPPVRLGLNNAQAGPKTRPARRPPSLCMRRRAGGEQDDAPVFWRARSVLLRNDVTTVPNSMLFVAMAPGRWRWQLWAPQSRKWPADTSAVEGEAVHVLNRAPIRWGVPSTSLNIRQRWQRGSASVAKVVEEVPLHHRRRRATLFRVSRTDFRVHGKPADRRQTLNSACVVPACSAQAGGSRARRCRSPSKVPPHRRATSAAFV